MVTESVALSIEVKSATVAVSVPVPLMDGVFIVDVGVWVTDILYSPALAVPVPVT